MYYFFSYVELLDAQCVDKLGAVDTGYVDLAAALTHVMHFAVPIPAVAAASVLHSAAVGGSFVGVMGTLKTFGELNNCELGVFRF